jgi:hypothetical protein
MSYELEMKKRGEDFARLEANLQNEVAILKAEAM